MMRVIVTASSNLPGTSAYPEARSDQADKLRSEDHPQQAERTDDHDERRRDEIGQRCRFFAAPLRQILSKHRHECRRQRALSKQITRQIWNAKPDVERVVRLARTEQRGHYHLAHQPRDAAREDGNRHDPRGAE
jgi:hypothetical protein